MFSFAVAALLVLFLCGQCLEKHERGRSALWVLKAVEDVNQFPGYFFIVIAGRKQSCGAIGCFHRNLEASCDGNQGDGLRFAFSVQELVNDRSIQTTCTRTFRLGPPPLTHLRLEPLWKANRLTHRTHFVIIPASLGSRFATLYRQK